MTASPESLVSVKSGAGSPSATIIPSSSRRAVGVVRVSRVGDRDGERFVSPTEQRERIEKACTQDGLALVDVFEELDVSGGAPLARRPGLGRAVELVERGGADVLVVAYFDRLVRSLIVQREVVERVEVAGGAILAVDVGEVRADTASRWLSSTMLGMVAEYHRRVTAERTADAKQRAIARGVPPFPNVPPGYRRTADGSLKPNPREAKIVARAFDMRAAGSTVAEVREYLRDHGIERSFHGVQALLASRILLGELRFGKIVNPKAHAAIVSRDVFNRVQRMRVARGRRPKSERLLARLGVLRCATCGARLVVGSTDQPSGRYWFYRCNPTSDCPHRVTISADIAEEAVVNEVKRLLRGRRGTASLEKGLAKAEDDLAAREKALDAAVGAFTGLEDVESARDRLLTLHDECDAARDRVDELRAASAPALTITASDDWERLNLAERRALVRAIIERVDVAPGRGADRLRIQAFGK